MTYDDILPFLEQNHRAALTTFRKNGAAQMSIVLCGAYNGGVAFGTPQRRAKLTNLLRDPRCTILVSKEDWWGYVVIEGTADILWSDRTDPEELLFALREVYRVSASQDHPDWDEYDQAMAEDNRAAIIVRPQHIYGVRP